MNIPIIAYRANMGVQTSAPFSNTKSIYFDGTDQYLNIGAPSALSNTTNFSISCWVKKGTSSLAYKWICGKYISAADNIIVGIRDSTNFLRFFITNGGITATVDSNVAIGVNVWQNVTVVFDGGLVGNQNRAKIYVDGVNVTATDSGTIPASTSSNASSFILSKVNGLVGGNWLGNLDEFSIFNYSLTQQNVTDIFNLGTPNNLDLLSTPPTNWYRNGDGLDAYPNIYNVGTSTSNNGVMINMIAGDIVPDVPL